MSHSDASRVRTTVGLMGTGHALHSSGKRERQNMGAEEEYPSSEGFECALLAMGHGEFRGAMVQHYDHKMLVMPSFVRTAVS